MTTSLEAEAHGPRRPRELAPVAWLPVAGVAAAVFVVLLLVAGRYGYHRDELYFIAASKHMAWGYVDQPPLSVALVWLARRLFGDSLYGLRLFPALAFAAAVVLSGLTARELGGRRFAQTLAALLLAVSPFLILAHLAGPTVYDLVGWALVMLVVLRILRTGDQRLWLLVGLIVGVSLYAKHTILFLVDRAARGLRREPPMEGAHAARISGSAPASPSCCGCPTCSGRRITAGPPWR